MRRLCLSAFVLSVVLAATSGVAAAQSAAESSGEQGPPATLFGLMAVAAVAVVLAPITILLLRRGRVVGAPASLGRAVRELIGVMDEAELARVAAVQATAHTGAAGAVLLRTDNDRLRRLGPAEESVDTCLEEVVTSGATLRREVDADPALSSEAAAVLAVPVVTAGHVVGVLAVHGPPSAPFGEDDRHVLERLARAAAASLADLDHRGSRRALTLMDPVTELGNRRRLARDLNATVATANRTTMSVALARIAVDGTPAAEPDEVVRDLGATIAANVRAGDVVYRSHDTEFAVLLPGADNREAARVADRVRHAAEQSTVNEALGTTVSIGVATSQTEASAEALAAVAEGALAVARQTGNCVTVA